MDRSAYTYFHLPMIVGIITVRAVDEFTVAHPGDPGTFASVSLSLGGAALFVAGRSFYMWTTSGRMPWSRLAVAVALAALAPVGLAVPTLALTVAAALILVLLEIWDSVTYRRRMRASRESTA